MARIIHDPGDIVVVGAVFRVDGVLTNPTTLLATVTNPQGDELDSTTAPTAVEVTIGTAAPLEQLHELGITAAENTAEIGVCTVRFRAAIQNATTAAAFGTWVVRLQGTGTADGTEFVNVKVRKPPFPFTWTTGVTLS